MSQNYQAGPVRLRLGSSRDELTSIDCQECPVRGLRCDVCIVPVIAHSWLESGNPSLDADQSQDSQSDELTEDEWAAVDVFVGAGLVSLLDAAEATAQREVAPAGSWLSEVG